MQKGKFEAADKGTIFLDEISLLGSDLQGKLLRVLQEHAFQRIGSNRKIEVDVRVITATNQDLKEMVDAGRFREDLYYRLNVVPIHIPPLRMRRDDIPALVDHFIRRVAQEHPEAPTQITQGALDALMEYDWPGNVRELENCIENAVVLCDGEVLSEEQLNFLGRTGWEQPTEGASTGDPLTLKEQIEHTERRILERTLDQVGGNRTRAAEMLGLSTRALRYKIKQYGL